MVEIVGKLLPLTQLIAHRYRKAHLWRTYACMRPKPRVHRRESRGLLLSPEAKKAFRSEKPFIYKKRPPHPLDKLLLPGDIGNSN